MFKYGPAPSGLLWGNKLLFAFLVGLVLVKYIFNALLVSNELCSTPLFLLSNEVWKKSGQVRWQKMTQYSEITPSLSERPILMETNSWWSKEKPYKWAKPPYFHGHYHQVFFQKGRGQVQFSLCLKGSWGKAGLKQSEAGYASLGMEQGCGAPRRGVPRRWEASVGMSRAWTQALKRAPWPATKQENHGTLRT